MERGCTSASASNAGELYPIREVSRITGVNSVTLRAWERRYGLITPLRTGKGHRLYNNDHISLIQSITEWIDRGVPVSKVKKLLQQSPASPEQMTSEIDEEWSKRQKSLVSAIRDFDEPEVDNIYSSALKLYPVEVVTEHMLKPALNILSQDWPATGQVSSEQGFLFSFLRNSIGARIYHASQHNSGPLILCANCLEDQHELDSWLLALSVCSRAGRARLLPYGVPLYDIGITAVRSQCDAVLLHSHKALHRETIERELPRLVRVLQRPLAISGQCTSIHGDAFKFIDLTNLGSNAECSARELMGACRI